MEWYLMLFEKNYFLVLFSLFRRRRQIGESRIDGGGERSKSLEQKSFDQLV